MRGSTPSDESGVNLWQSLQWVLLGVLCVVVCFFIGSYWLGPWLHQWRESRQTSPSEPTQLVSPTPQWSPPAAPAPLSPTTARLDGVRIREVRPDRLPDVVRVLSARQESPAPQQEEQEPATIEEQPPAPADNLWSSPSGEPAEAIQQPQPLDSVSPSPPPSSESPSGVLYRVRVPSVFDQREQADDLLRSLQEKGLPGTIVADTVDGRKVFRVQLGVYRNRANAENLAARARRERIDVEVTASAP